MFCVSYSCLVHVVISGSFIVLRWQRTEGVPCDGCGTAVNAAAVAVDFEGRVAVGFGILLCFFRAGVQVYPAC